MEKTNKRDILKFRKKRQSTASESLNVESVNVSSLMDIDNEYLKSIYKTNLTNNEDTVEVSLRSKCKSVESIQNNKSSIFYVNIPTTINEEDTDSAEKKRKGVSVSSLNKFRRYFPQISKKEIVINYFSCALVRDILLQGHLYITAERIAFHCNVFGYVRNLIIPTSSIRRLTKEKTANILPNAVGVTTSEGCRINFVNFFSRDSAFLLMSSVCPKLLPEDEVLVQTSPQPDSKECSIDSDSNCSINDFETVSFKRSLSRSIANKDIHTKATKSNIVSVAQSTTSRQKSTWLSSKIHAIILTEELAIFLIALLTLFLTSFSIFFLYRIIDIDARASSYHTTSNLKLVSAGSNRVSTEGVLEAQQILENLDQIEEVRRSLETLSKLIQNETFVLENGNNRERE